MFVVRIKNDEALMFRTFSRPQAARNWICRHIDADPSSTAVDLYEVPGCGEVAVAVAAVRDGRCRHVASGEKLMLQDFQNRSGLMAGMGVGTGAGF